MSENTPAPTASSVAEQVLASAKDQNSSQTPTAEQSIESTPTENLQQTTQNQTSEETKVEKTAEQLAEDKKFASKFAALSKREKMLVAKEKELSSKTKELEEKFKQLEGALKLKELAKTDPDKYLEEGGLSYDELTKFYLNDKKPAPEKMFQSLQEEIKALKDQLNQEKEEKTRREQEAELMQFRSKIKDTVQQSDKYELIKTYGQEEVVFETILAHLAENNRVLSIEEAADLVENYLEREVEEGHQKLSKTKLASKLFKNVQASPAEKSTSAAQVPKGKVSETLTNNMAQEAVSRSQRPLSYEERVAEAAKMLKWS
jgi:hypothetical protein